MFGAIIGDIVGSRFEFSNYLGKDFPVALLFFSIYNQYMLKHNN